MSYDSWLTHNPADDGGEQDLELVLQCDNEFYDEITDETFTCDFDDAVELFDVWVSYNGWASGEWTCPKCGKVSEFELEVPSGDDREWDDD